MKYGFVFPDNDVIEAILCAEAAEAAGWDGFFVWDGVWATDPWVTLGGIAARTERIRIGTMITPMSRRRPWKLASETATVDRLSGGRLILSVGLGALDTGFEAFGEETGRRTRAELLDEGLAIITGLWRGQPFEHHGKHYQVEAKGLPMTCPPPLQQPRIPIWVVGVWPVSDGDVAAAAPMGSMERALRYDGLLPDVMVWRAGGRRRGGKGRGSGATWQRRALAPADVAAMRAYVDVQLPSGPRATETFDIVVEGTTPGDDPAAAAAIVSPWVAAGATWWIEAQWDAVTSDTIRDRIRQGPPNR